MMISKFRNLLFWVRSWIPCHCCERGVFKWDHLPTNGKIIQHPKLFNKNKLFHISANQKIKILQRLWICFTKQKKKQRSNIDLDTKQIHRFTISTQHDSSWCIPANLSDTSCWTSVAKTMRIITNPMLIGYSEASYETPIKLGLNYAQLSSYLVLTKLSLLWPNIPTMLNLL